MKISVEKIISLCMWLHCAYSLSKITKDAINMQGGVVLSRHGTHYGPRSLGSLPSLLAATFCHENPDRDILLYIMKREKVMILIQIGISPLVLL